MANTANHRRRNVLIGRLTLGRLQVRFAETGLIKLEPQFAELGTGQVTGVLGDNKQRRWSVWLPTGRWPQRYLAAFLEKLTRFVQAGVTQLQVKWR